MSLPYQVIQHWVVDLSQSLIFSTIIVSSFCAALGIVPDIQKKNQQQNITKKLV